MIDWLIGDEQAGFGHGFSTVGHIFNLHAIIQIYLNKKQKLFCAFIDYKKTFDYIDRTFVWMKLISSGIDDNTLKVIYNSYDDAKSYVKMNGKSSGYFKCNIGVMQGENLSS